MPRKIKRELLHSKATGAKTNWAWQGSENLHHYKDFIRSCGFLIYDGCKFCKCTRGHTVNVLPQMIAKAFYWKIKCLWSPQTSGRPCELKCLKVNGEVGCKYSISSKTSVDSYMSTGLLISHISRLKNSFIKATKTPQTTGHRSWSEHRPGTLDY